jgi:hypothetical protein
LQADQFTVFVAWGYRLAHAVPLAARVHGANPNKGFMQQS